MYVHHLFKYFSYVAHVVPRAMACWIACRSRAVAHAVRALPRALFRMSIARCLRVAIVRSRIRAACLVRVLFAHVVSLSFACCLRVIVIPSRVRVAHISRIDHVCRAASARDNKLFSLINTHVNNVNSSGRIF